MTPLKHRVVTLLARHAPRILPLRHLAGVHGTNKIRIADADYAAVYEHYLRPWRRRQLTLLELGVFRGESLRLWRSYFPRARIVGLDIDPEAARRAPGFTVYVGSQADEELLDRVKRDLPVVDIVVDDASHVNHLTVASFRALFPHVKPGGLYFIEDVGAACAEIETVRSWPGMALNDDAELVSRPEDLNELLVSLAEDTLEGHRRLVEFVHVWPRMIVVGRSRHVAP